MPYELRLGTLTLADGGTVAGGGSSGRVPAGETGGVTGAWELSEGSTPATPAVTGIAYRDDGPDETSAEVTLAKVPVRGG